MADAQITGKVGLNVKPFKDALDEADGAARGWSDRVKSHFGDAFSDVGSKLKRVFGVGELSRSLVGAIGIDPKEISDKVAAGLEGGSKEGWQKAAELADKEMDLIEDRMKEHMSSGELAKYYEKAIDKAIEESKKGPAKHAVLDKLGGVGNFLRNALTDDSDASREQKQMESRVKILELTKKQEEAQKRVLEIEWEDADAAEETAMHYANKEQQMNLLMQHAAELQLRLDTVDMTEDERRKIGKEIADTMQRQTDLTKEIKKQDEELKQSAEDRKAKMASLFAEEKGENAKLLDLKAQIMEYDKRIAQVGEDKVEKERLLNEQAEKQRDYNKEILELQKRQADEEQKVAQAQANVANYRQEKSGMTLKELASIGSFAPGASIKTTQDAEKARQALDLQQKAEQARLGGDSKTFNSLTDQAAAIKGNLSELKPSERQDQTFKALNAALEREINLLAEIKDLARGKVVNQ